MNKVIQCNKILRFLEIHGTITQRQAINYGIYRLASRIHDLKEQGIGIKTEMIEVKNADNTTSHVARYSLIEGEADPADIFGGEDNE